MSKDRDLDMHPGATEVGPGLLAILVAFLVMCWCAVADRDAQLAAMNAPGAPVLTVSIGWKQRTMCVKCLAN